MLEYFLGFVSAFLVVAFVVFRIRNPGNKIAASAHRIGLRDKGQTQRNKEGLAWVHDPCGTRTRIGIDYFGLAHEYCWRCEEFILEDNEPDDPGREDLPVEEGADEKIIDLSKRRVA